MKLRRLGGTVAVLATAAVLLTMVLVPAAGAGRVSKIIQFDGDTATGYEGNDAGATISLWRNFTGEPATVYVSTTRGTAVAGTDYTALVKAPVTFASDSQYADVTLQIPTEGVPGEPDETIKLALSNPSAGWRLGKPRTATVTIMEMPLPPASTGLITTNNSVGQLTLQWTQVPTWLYGPVKYLVWRADGASSTCSQGSTTWLNLTASAPTSGPTFVDTTALQGNTYTYCVQSINADNAVSSGFAGPIITQIQPLGPPSITSITATASTSPWGINVDWDVSSDVPGVIYRVSRGLSSTSLSTLVDVYGPTTTAYTDVTVTAGTVYYYRVVAIVDGVSSTPSEVVSATSPAAP